MLAPFDRFGELKMNIARKLMALVFTCLLLTTTACGKDKEAEATATPIPPTVAAAAAATSAPTATAIPAAAADTATPQAAAASASGTSDPQQAVLNAMHAQLNGGPYRATTSVDAGGTITEMKTEVIPPDTMHVVIGGGNLEMILINGVLWSKNSGSDWQQMGSPDMMKSIFDSIQSQFDADSLHDVVYAGQEPVMGVQTDVYSFTTSLGAGADVITSTAKLWVGQQDGLPVRMEADGMAQGVSTHTVQSIEYDKTITITAPAP